jgi:hypothetical protein
MTQPATFLVTSQATEMAGLTGFWSCSILENMTSFVCHKHGLSKIKSRKNKVV